MPSGALSTLRAWTAGPRSGRCSGIDSSAAWLVSQTAPNGIGGSVEIIIRCKDGEGFQDGADIVVVVVSSTLEKPVAGSTTALTLRPVSG